MTIKFYTNRLESSPKITRVQVSRETDTAVYFRPSHGVVIRQSKRSSNWNYFDTWEEARDHLLDAERKIIADAERTIEKILALRPPR